MSLDAASDSPHFPGMAKNVAKSAFKQQFIERTKDARIAAGYSQDRIAQALDIAQDTYKNYEVNRELPHALIPRFCAITQCSIAWLYTGKSSRSAA